MRVLFVPSATRRSPAARYRVYQYRELLDRRGVDYAIFPAVSDLTTRYMLSAAILSSGRRRLYYAWVIAERFARFLPIVVMARRFDVVFLQRTTFFGLEWLLQKSCENLVFDFDDAIFMRDTDEREPRWLQRAKGALKSFEVTRVLRASKVAIVENQYLRRYAEAQGASVEVIAGPIDTDYFRPGPPRPTSSGPVTIGWIGSPSTAPYLAALRGVLARLAARYDICFKTVGAGDYSIPGVKTVSVPWSLDTELAELQSFDIGVMPMPVNAWTLGKLGCKMLLYMAVGVAPAVSLTSTNAEVIVDGVNGVLVASEDDWLRRLSELVADAALRERLGSAARATAERQFSLRLGGDKLIEVLDDVVGTSRRPGRGRSSRSGRP